MDAKLNERKRKKENNNNRKYAPPITLNIDMFLRLFDFLYVKDLFAFDGGILSPNNNNIRNNNDNKQISFVIVLNSLAFKTYCNCSSRVELIRMLLCCWLLACNSKMFSMPWQIPNIYTNECRYGRRWTEEFKVRMILWQKRKNRRKMNSQYRRIVRQMNKTK